MIEATADPKQSLIRRPLIRRPPIRRPPIRRPPIRNSLDHIRTRPHNSGMERQHMEHQQLVKLSKRMSKVLRHQPERAGLTLDAAGWVPVDEFLTAMRIDRDDLNDIVAGNDKQRFAVEVGADGVERIRASQGHSVAVNLALDPATPPAVLFHGTSAAALDSIRATGINRGGRHHVHLSADTPTAQRVGSRRPGQVAIITVDAAAMARDGHVFFISANGVWLTDAVPAKYLTF
jgi:putative RNA 2'-phosphotransferase